MNETTTISVILTLAFADATSRNMKFNGVDQEASYNVKSKVLAINANMPAAFKTTFVSDNGAECTMISKAQKVVTREEVIYSAN